MTMELHKTQAIDIPMDLIEAIKSFPVRREVTHCGEAFRVSPFDIYADCPRCGTRIKVRSFSGVTEVADVFDAVFAWMNQSEVREIVRRRQQVLEEDTDE